MARWPARSGRMPTTRTMTVETAIVDGKFVTVRVRDEGPGIPKTELKRVFRRFHRVPGPLASRVKGTGLGLYIVRLIAQFHGGATRARNNADGTGVVLTVELPAIVPWPWGK